MRATPASAPAPSKGSATPRRAPWSPHVPVTTAFPSTNRQTSPASASSIAPSSSATAAKTSGGSESAATRVATWRRAACPFSCRRIAASRRWLLPSVTASRATTAASATDASTIATTFCIVKLLVIRSAIETTAAIAGAAMAPAESGLPGGGGETVAAIAIAKIESAQRVWISVGSAWLAVPSARENSSPLAASMHADPRADREPPHVEPGATEGDEADGDADPRPLAERVGDQQRRVDGLPGLERRDERCGERGGGTGRRHDVQPEDRPKAADGGPGQDPDADDARHVGDQEEGLNPGRAELPRRHG